MQKLKELSDRKEEELEAQMKRTAAFYAAFSFITGFVFTDLVVMPTGVIVPADLDMILLNNYSPFSMLHRFFRHFASDEDFVALSTKFFMKLRSLSSSIYMAFRVYFDAEDLTQQQQDFAQYFVSHLSRYSLFDIPPLRAEKMYAEELRKIVTLSESQFDVIRKKTGEGLAAIWATISAVPGQLFGGEEGESVDIKDEPVEAGNVAKAEAEVEGEGVVKQDAAAAAAAAASSS